MLRSWLVCCAALALVLPAARGDEGVPVTKTLEQQQKEMLTKLGQIQNDIASLKDRLDKIDANKSSSLDASDIKSKLDDLRSDVQRIQSQLNGDQRSASGFSRMPQGGEPQPKHESFSYGGTSVRLINDFVTTQDIMVNDRVYSVAPGEVREVPVPPGEFTYRVLGVDVAPRISSVGAGLHKPIRLFVP